MNKDLVKNIALILLLGIAAFSMVKYVSELQERYKLQDHLTQAQGRIIALAQEKQNLLQNLKQEQELKQQLELKNTNLRDYLKASKNRIARLFQDNNAIQNDLAEAGAKLSILKTENQELVDSRRRFYFENEEFKLKLSSIVELKKAIKELKLKQRAVSISETEGNRGFMIKDGRLIPSAKIKIEVVPAQTKE